jgi:HD-GYP domain-containing protein (c-di-GMP phosphodiesterase class II)
MSHDTQQPWFSGISKKGAMLITVCGTLCVFAVAWFVCSVQYRNEKQAIMASYRENLTSWVSGTVRAVTLWTENLASQTQRVSGSDLYRLFASELAQMDERTTALINDAESGVSLPESAASLAEDVPLIRNTLLDFMNYSGLQDARIVGGRGQTLLSALSRPSPVTPEQRATAMAAIHTGRMAFAPVRGSASGLVLDVADPLLLIMGSEGAEHAVAALMITTPITGQVAQFLARDLRRNDLFPHLLQKRDGRWEEVRVQSPEPVFVDAVIIGEESASADGSPLLAFGLREGLNGTGAVYSVGAAVPGMDWWILLEIPAPVVNGELHGVAWLVYGIGALISLGVVLGMALLWWVLIGRQQRVIAERFQSLYAVIARQKRLLDSVNVSLDVGLFMADLNGGIQIGNRAFAGIVRKDEDALAGSTLSSLFDGKASGLLLDNIRKVEVSDENLTFELSLAQPDGEHLYRVTLFPFVDEVEGAGEGAVGIMQDITEFRRNSEKRRQQQIHTMNAFVRAIEGVDPYLAGHSQKMAELGALVAGRLGLSETDRNTIVQAADLSQVGKLFVPRELLGKSGKLTEEEQNEMNKVPEHAYRVLKDIDFDLPVPRTVYEMYERMDGSGYPQRLAGNAISVYARVLAAVNAFCAMVSPRSYRKGMAFDEAIGILRENPGSFDPEVVNALSDVIHSPEGAQSLTKA